MADSDKHQTEKIHFALQGMTDNAQVVIAVAIGIFGILGIFVSINNQSDLWTKSAIQLTAAIVILSVAYWGVVVLGLSSYIFRRLFEGLMDECTRIEYPEYQSEIRKIAKENKLTHLVVKVLWPSNHSVRGTKYKGIWIFSIVYIIICFFLWFFLGLYPSLQILFDIL